MGQAPREQGNAVLPPRGGRDPATSPRFPPDSGRRRAASCGAGGLARASLPAQDSRRRGAPPASLQPRRLWPGSVAARQPAIPLWEPASALGWPGRGRRARASSRPGRRPRCGERPRQAALGTREGSCARGLLPREEACKTADSSRSWKTQLWQSAARPAGSHPPPPPPAPTPHFPLRPVPRGDNCDLLLRDCRRLEGSLCVCPGQCSSGGGE